MDKNASCSVNAEQLFVAKHPSKGPVDLYLGDIGLGCQKVHIAKRIISVSTFYLCSSETYTERKSFIKDADGREQSIIRAYAKIGQPA